MRLMQDHSELCDIIGYQCIKCYASNAKDFVPIPKPPYTRDTTDYDKISMTFDEIFSSYTWPGGYNVLFTDDAGDIFCADCAKKAFVTEDIEITADIYHEGPTLYCDECNKRIESAYGDPEDEE